MSEFSDTEVVLTQSFEELSPEEIAREEILDEARRLLDDNDDQNTNKKQNNKESTNKEDKIQKLRALVARADADTKKEIDALILSRMPDKLSPGSDEELLFSCTYDKLTGPGDVCKPSCLRGYQTEDSGGCEWIVYEKKGTKLRRLTDRTGKNVRLYIVAGVNYEDDLGDDLENNSEDDLREKLGQIFEEQPDASEVLIYEQDPASGEYSKTCTAHVTRDANKQKKKNPHPWGCSRNTAAAIVLTIVLLFVIVVVAIAMRWW